MIKVCECGCGQEFEVNKRWRYRKNAQRFISGHNLRVPETKEKTIALRAGKTYEEIFGEEKAKELKIKCAERGKQIGGNPAWIKGCKGERAGVKLSEEQKKHLSEINTGKKHSQKTKNICREKALAGNYGNWLIGRTIPEEVKEKMSNARAGVMPKNQTVSGKYGNIKRGYFNIFGVVMFFRSKWEANYARYLTLLLKSKSIKGWEYEIDTFMFQEIKLGTRSYTPDFKITTLKDEIIYYEIKGYMDAKSKTKIKRMAKYYPDIHLEVIDSKKYNSLNKMYKDNIPGWNEDPLGENKCAALKTAFK